MMWGKRKETAQVPPRDLAAELDVLNAEIARRSEQRSALLTDLAQVEATRDGARGTREALAVAALGERDETAQQQRREALAAFTAAEADAEDHRTAIDRIDGILQSLSAQRRTLDTDRARAAMLAVARDEIVPALARADAACTALVAALKDAAAAKRRQASIAHDGNLPEAREHKRFALDYVEWVLRWTLQEFGFSGTRHHAFRECSLVDMELMRQGLAPGVDPTENAEGQSA